MTASSVRPIQEARHMVIVGVLRDGTARLFADLLGELREVHCQGRWPQADWLYARNDPYDVGLRQHLEQLRDKSWVERVTRHDGYPRWRIGPEAPPPPDPEEVKRLAEALLPGEDVAELVARLQSQARMPILVGVDFYLRRVIRVGTQRGHAEFVVRADQTWEQALAELPL